MICTYFCCLFLLTKYIITYTAHKCYQSDSPTSQALSMAHYFTPTLPRESTVFMTPSSSSGKPVYPKPMVTPLAFSLFSPAPTPVKRGRTTQGSTDVLTELYMCGVPHVVDTILAMLPPSALCRYVLHV